MSDTIEIKESGPEPAKKKLSPEHIASMKAGRLRALEKRAAKKRQVHTRTRDDVRDAPSPTTAERSMPSREDMSRMPEEQLTRRTRDERDIGSLNIPARLRKPGWDYEYKSIRCMGQPVDGSDVRVWYEAGWRPVLGRDMPEQAAPGADLNLPIEEKGCHLYTRPTSLTMQAKQEDEDVARRQLRDKAMQAATGRGDAGLPRGMGVRGVPVQFEIENVGGTGTGRGA